MIEGSAPHGHSVVPQGGKSQRAADGQRLLIGSLLYFGGFLNPSSPTSRFHFMMGT